MQRRLTAILAADVVGYSKLMADDESGTLAALRAHRKEIFDPTTAQHGGRIVKLMGDGTLVEFPSVVDAVLCALAIQRSLAEQPGPIKLRIGINLGDVIIDGDDIYGDGVNIAARLESHAAAGGICISSVVHDQIRRKVEAEFTSLGKKTLKNIPEPMDIWVWTPLRSQQTTLLSGPLTLPDKPSIAVLPFTNMSGDQEQDYFADGMTEDILTGLSKCRWLFVIARNSTFAYKGTPTDIRTVGQELGVRYVLEGSVRKSANRVRITAQLIDAIDGKHLWVERYDRVLADIFELQDEITATIVGTIEPELGTAELTRSQGKSIENLDAWDSYLRARWHTTHGDSKEALFESIRLCDQAIAANPDMACAYSELAVAHISAVPFQYTSDRAGSIQLAFEAGQRAVHLDSKDSLAHSALGRVYDFRGQLDAAVQSHKVALSLNPNSAIAHLFLASTYNHAGNPALALNAAEQAYRLSPRDPRQWFMHQNRGIALSMLGRHDEAIEALQAACHSNVKSFWPQLCLATVLAHGGGIDESQKQLAVAMQHPHAFSNIRDIEATFASASDTYRNFHVIGARLAGMSE